MRLRRATAQRAIKVPTMPVLMSEELYSNPYLRIAGLTKRKVVDGHLQDDEEFQNVLIARGQECGLDVKLFVKKKEKTR